MNEPTEITENYTSYKDTPEVVEYYRQLREMHRASIERMLGINQNETPSQQNNNQ